MANPPKPWKAEYAKSSRSTCKTCKNTIAQDKLRIAKMVAASQFDGFMPVVGIVGFQHQRLPIPDSVDPAITFIIESCWQRDPKLRPSFTKIMQDLRPLQRMTMARQASSQI